MIINLYLLANPPVGGTMTYTHQLTKVLKHRGHKVNVYAVRKRSEPRLRQYPHGVSYRNLSLEDAITAMKDGPSIVATLYHRQFKEAQEQLLLNGATMIVHDPTDLHKGNYKVFKDSGCRIIAVKPVLVHQLQQQGFKSVYIPLPYTPAEPTTVRSIVYHAVCMTRIEWSKHPEVIAAANLLLPPGKRIKSWGQISNVYTYNDLDPKFPSWRQDYMGVFKSPNGGFDCARAARFSVDMTSVARGDGGAPQYTTLESWDAGAILVNAKGWLCSDPAFNILKHGEHALFVDGPEELAKTLKSTDSFKSVIDGGRRMLPNHGADVVGPLYEDHLKAC